MADLVSVPNVNGIPPVLFAPGFGGGIPLVGADTISFPAIATGSPWGVYGGGGGQVVQADTVVAMDYKEDWVIADFPLERGAFESYNKVATPFDVRFVFVAGQSLAARAALLASLDAVMGDLNLYDVVTPERVWSNVNFIHRDFRRTTQNGVGLLAVSVVCQQVRITVGAGATDPSSTGSIGNTASPSLSGQVNDGTVQPTYSGPGDIVSAQGQAFGGDYNVGGYDPSGTGTGTLSAANFGIGGITGGVPLTSTSIAGLTPASPT